MGYGQDRELGLADPQRSRSGILLDELGELLGPLREQRSKPDSSPVTIGNEHCPSGWREWNTVGG